jgi:outer membrane protein assembly factor BamE (lipoprotein component of BamABCDE complex)
LFPLDFLQLLKHTEPMKTSITTLVMAVSLCGCMSAADHAAQLPPQSVTGLTAGNVQREIRKGMTQAAVADVLGSPNIAARDLDGKESWIYDRIATEAAYSSGNNGILSILLGSRNAGAVASSQKTLTVIIKFTKGVVTDYSYHSSKF